MPELTKTYMRPGQRYEMKIGYSEAACHLGVAGSKMQVEITRDRWPMAQLYELTGEMYSFPITLGEAGIYTNGEVHYAHDCEEV